MHDTIVGDVEGEKYGEKLVKRDQEKKAEKHYKSTTPHLFCRMRDCAPYPARWNAGDALGPEEPECKLKKNEREPLIFVKGLDAFRKAKIEMADHERHAKFGRIVQVLTNEAAKEHALRASRKGQAKQVKQATPAKQLKHF